MPNNSAIDVGGIVFKLQADPTEMVRGLNDARRAVDLLEQEIKRLRDEFDQGTIGASDYVRMCRELDAAQQQLRTSMQAAYASLQQQGIAIDLVNDKLRSARQHQIHFGMGMMQVAYILDDFQYSILATVNNVGPLIASMTGDMGLATAAQISAVAVGVLVRHWDDFEAVVSGDATKTAAAEMSALEKATQKTADQQERLNTLKEREKTWTSIGNSKTAEQKATSEAATKAIEGLDGRAVEKGLRDLMFETFKPSKTDVEKEEKSIFRQIDPRSWGKTGLVGPMVAGALNATVGELPSPEKAAEEKAKTRSADAAKKMLDEAINDRTPNRDHLRALIGHVKANPGFFPKGLAEQLQQALPENVKADQEWEAMYADTLAQIERDKAGDRAENAAGNRGFREDAKKARATREADKAQFKANMDFAKTLLPDIEDQVSRFGGLIELGQISTEEADNALAAQLEARGMNRRDAIDAVRGFGTAERERKTPDDRSRARLRSNMATVGTSMPDLDEMARFAVAQGKLAGVPMDQISQQLKTLIREVNPELGDKEAKEVADQFASTANKQIMSRVARRRFMGDDLTDDELQPRASRVFGTADLYRQIQSGVGGQNSEQKRHTDLLTQTVEMLAGIKNAIPVAPRVIPRR